VLYVSRILVLFQPSLYS